MRLVSYNILEGGTGRADPLAEILLAQRPDIAVLLETQDPTVVERIAARLEFDFVRGGDERQSATVLSRWPIEETVDHGAARGGISKSLVEAIVRAPDGREWPVAAVHLHAGAFDEDERRREAELEAVLGAFERYRRTARPHLLAGDFNSDAPYQQIDPGRCKPSTRRAWDASSGGVPRRVVQALLDAGYLDTLRAFDELRAATDVSFTTLHPGQRVDYIFSFGIDRARVRDAWIEHDRLARYASDHYPVGVEIADSVPAGNEKARAEP